MDPSDFAGLLLVAIGFLIVVVGAFVLGQRVLLGNTKRGGKQPGGHANITPTAQQFAAAVRHQREARVRQVQAREKLISDIDCMDGIAFEKYVAALLVHQGFVRVRVTKGSGDFGVDVVASFDKDRFAIQVKRHSKKISRRAVSDAVAGQSHYGCNRAMVISNNFFTADCKTFASSVGCRLVARDELIRWAIHFHRLQDSDSSPTTSTMKQDANKSTSRAGQDTQIPTAGPRSNCSTRADQAHPSRRAEPDHSQPIVCHCGAQNVRTANNCHKCKAPLWHPDVFS